MTLEWRPNNRSLIDLLERVLEKGLLVVSWLRPTNSAGEAGTAAAGENRSATRGEDTLCAAA